MKMYDVHAHLGVTSSGEKNSAAQLVRELQACGVERVGVSSLSGCDIRAQNNLVRDAMREFPHFIHGYAFINPKAPDAMDEIDRCLGDFHMSGVKFAPIKHGYYSDNCPALAAVLSRVLHYGKHIQVAACTSPLATPFAWIRAAEAFPKLDVVLTHIAGREFGYSAVLAAKDVPNVWMETSEQMEYETLLAAARELGARRMVFGTDWPYKPTRVEIEKLRHLHFTDEELELVYYRNAEYLWRYE